MTLNITCTIFKVLTLIYSLKNNLLLFIQWAVFTKKSHSFLLTVFLIIKE